MELIKLTIENKEEIKSLFKLVFMGEPWNDDWSDEKQLDSYILDLIGNNNSLTLGLSVNGELVGCALGAIKHWYTGTEFYIDELFIRTDMQGNGLGSSFIKLIEEYLKANNINHIFLQTERTMPAYEFYIKRNFTELKDHVSFLKEL